MKERRFASQYRLGEDGPAYAGTYWRFPPGAPGARKRALRAAPYVAAYWLFALVYLRTARVTGRTFYALIPALASLFPGAYAVMGLFALLRAPERMTAIQREKGVGRLLRSGLGAAALIALGAAGCAVRLTLARAWAEGWFEALAPLAAAVAAAGAFRTARADWRALVEEA